jgi:hypothetical protein
MLLLLLLFFHETQKASSVHNTAIIGLFCCRDNLCAMLSAHPDVVNIKAKTHEKVDSLGEERSIACHTVVLLIRSEDG